MKYKVLIAIAVVSIGTILLDFKKEAHGNVNGAPAGVTGSPTDGLTCAASGCHTGSAVVASPGWITSNIPGTGYVPGTAYTITATATMASLVRFGFEISPQSASGNLVGTLTAGAGTQVIGAGKYITHTSAGTTGTTGSHTWTFTWTAPASGTGPLSFYGAFNCTNNDTHTSGDQIHTSSMAVTEAPTNGLDCGIYSIIYPAGFDCSGNLAAVVNLQNYGNTTITNCTINYKIDAGAVNTFTWYGNLASQTSMQVTLPALASTPGAHTYTAFTTLPNGSADVLVANDSKTVSYTTVTTPATLPFFEGFETATMPPAGWVRVNPDNLTTWNRSTTVHYTGAASAYMDNYNYNAIGQRDELVTPPLDLTSSLTPSLTFQVAYQPYSTTTNLDTLIVEVSADCGLTWSSVYNKSGSTLGSVAGVNTSAFVPTTTSQWRQETVSLAAYHTSSSFLVRFINACQYGNQLYIDDINIAGPAGIAELNNKPVVNLFPNPINDILTLEYTLAQTAAVSVKMFDIQGREITELVSEKGKAAGKYSSSFDMKGYKAGMYFIAVTTGNNVSTEKLMIVH